jgi:hypothetical protein
MLSLASYRRGLLLPAKSPFVDNRISSQKATHLAGMILFESRTNDQTVILLISDVSLLIFDCLQFSILAQCCQWEGTPAHCGRQSTSASRASAIFAHKLSCPHCESNLVVHRTSNRGGRFSCPLLCFPRAHAPSPSRPAVF